MSVREALAVLVDGRGDDDVVVTNQGTARVWPLLDRRVLDFHYNPSTMSGAVPFALGLAIAQPARRIIVLTGDGSLLMSLGCLVSVAAARADNLTLILMDNGMYEVTGGQKTPAADTVVDLPGVARASGFPTVAQFHSAEAWRAQLQPLLSAPGPRFVSLRVQATRPDDLKTKPTPLPEQLQRLITALQH
jgi:thiamine pyrophosphate-dependent acetolactate synthase large subunit-like protein